MPCQVTLAFRQTLQGHNTSAFLSTADASVFCMLIAEGMDLLCLEKFG